MAEFSITGFISRVSKRCKNWDNNKVFISKIDSYDANICLIVDGKLKHIKTGYRSDYYVDLISPLLEEYFLTGEWDESIYYVKQLNGGKRDYSRVFKTNGKVDVSNVLKLLRVTEKDAACGITEIPKNEALNYNIVTV